LSTGDKNHVLQPSPFGNGVLYKKNITHIAAGVTHSVVVDSEGRAYCFGSNNFGECGQGVTGGNYPDPREIVSIDTFNHKKIVHASVSKFRTYLRDEKGNVYYCGKNDFSEVSPQLYNEPMGFVFRQSISCVSVSEHILILSQGQVFGFGSNSVGQLGIGKTSENEPLPVTVNTTGILPGKRITQISAGGQHSLLLSSDGQVFGFGENRYGQLGIGTTSKQESLPVAVSTTGVLQGKIIAQISAGYAYSLLLSSDGQVFGFGQNQGGQLGRGIETTTWTEPRPVAVNTTGVLQGKIIIQISAGLVHSLVLSSDGQVFGFGQNNYGQLGIGTPSEKELHPVAVNMMGVLFKNVTHISVYQHGVMTDSHGDVFSYGDNMHGKLGDGTVITRIGKHKIANVLSAAFESSTGDAHSLVLFSDGQVFAFGSNAYGQLGIEKISEELVPQELLPIAIYTTGVLQGKIIIQISAGGQHSLLLSSDGQVFGFGQNRHGQLGIGLTSEKEPRPIAVNTTGVLQGKIIIQISAGLVHSLVLSSDGQVFGFGDNTYGQLGIGRITWSEKLPIAVNTTGALQGKRIVQMSAGTTHSLVLSSDGQVFGFGSNVYGQLGMGRSTFWSEKEPLPIGVNMTSALQGKIITQISAGDEHSLVLSSEGHVFGFGMNQYGQLGIGRTSGKESLPVTVNTSHIFLPASHTTRIFAGKYHSFLSYCHSRACFGNDHRYPMVCSGHGECVQEDLCSCHKGYTEPNCSHALCFDVSGKSDEVCYGHGRCVSPNTCECMLKEGFLGERCNQFLCGRILNTEKTNVCSGHGTCIEPDTCECYSMHYGPECEGNVWTIILAVCIPLLVLTGGCTIFSCASLSTCVTVIVVKLFKKAKKANQEMQLTQNLLQGFVRDMEMDEMDADSQRARLIVQKSMLEIDFNELSHLEKIGSGGSGAILFRASWNGSKVAVKVFKSGLLSGETFFNEFEHEVSLMSTLRHRNIINFYGCSLAYPRIAIVMELCESGSIETLIEKGTLQKKPSHIILQMLLDVAEGMNYLHSRGVIHRDLKCANVLVDEHGVCKLTDFGLSKYTKDQVAKAHTVGIGTSYYAAPEVARGSGEYDESVDVYAFGIMAMEMLLARMCPFPGDTQNPLLVQQRAVQDADYRPDLYGLDDKYSFLRWVLKQCWHHDPSVRPPFRDIVKILKSSLFDTEH